MRRPSGSRADLVGDGVGCSVRAGELEERPKTRLDAPEAGTVWEPGEEAWEAKLAALCGQPQTALGKDQERAPVARRS
ncbi:hypothetical protein ACFQ9Z_34970 [Streptomyces sp. NPDC056580]|uniref:hypothetical protein n=1 Tax=Streptomyces sp. NPDC056580 TaxID=3345872 RepID=UPI00369CD774